MDMRVPVSLAAAITAAAAAVATLSAGSASPDIQPELSVILTRDFQFSRDEVVDLSRGKIVKHILPPTAPDEFGVVGAIRIQGSRERLVTAYRDIVTFKKNEEVPQIGRFSDPPSNSDLETLTTDRDDFDLRRCRVGDCDIRLPAAEIQRIGASIDWKRPDADARASMLFKQILLAHVRAYASGGPGRITQYDDASVPVKPVVAEDELIRASSYLDALRPGLSAHVACFWENFLNGAEDLLYWSKEK